MVFVVPVPGWDGDAAAPEKSVSGHVDRRMGKPFRPAHVPPVKRLPKTRSSKVMRRLNKRIYADQPLGDSSALDSPAALDEIRAVVVKS